MDLNSATMRKTLFIALALVAICVMPLYGQNPTSATTGTLNGHEWVDLGLPSGTLWATCNVGAEMPEDYGEYFAWGETQPKDTYDSINYMHCLGNFNTITKYCNNSEYGKDGFTDTLTELLDCDDPAIVWGANWRTPSMTQWEELLQNTTNKWTTQNDIKGMLFTAKNGHTLFIPAASIRWNVPVLGNGIMGAYWTSSLCTDEFNPPFRAWCFFFHKDGGDLGAVYRPAGLSVRPVTSSHE